MLPFDDLIARAGQVKIAHHIRGRIRLRLEDYPKDLPPPGQNPQRFQILAETMPGVRSVRVNALARSCLVEYDPSVIPDQAWKDFIAGRSSSSADILKQILRDIYQEIIHAKL